MNADADLAHPSTSLSLPTPQWRSAAVAFVALCLLLWPTWKSFPATWMAERTHGFAIAAFCVWQLWGVRHRLTPARDLQVIGLCAAAASGVMWLVALVIGVQVGHQLAAVGVLLGWAAATFGERGLRVVAPIAGIFTLAIPIWEFIVGVLQSMTVAVNHALVRVTGIEAELTGNQIRFPYGTLEVANSCAGLSFFMSALTISAIYGYLFLRSTRGRVMAIALALALGLVSNWLRVFGLVVIGYRTEMKHPLIADHGTYGWIIFAVVIALFFLLTRRIEQWEADHVPADHVPAAPHSPEHSDRAAASPRQVTHLIGTATAIAAAPLVLYAVLSLQRPDLQLPAEVPGLDTPVGWTARALPASLPATPDTGAANPRTRPAWAPAMNGAQHRRTVQFTPATGTAPAVRVDRVGYDGNTPGKELIGYGNAIAAPDAVVSQRLVGPLDDRLRMVHQAIVRDGAGARLVWYWYRVAGVETPSAARAKLLELVSFVRPRTPSELVAVSATCSRDNCQAALEAVHLTVVGRPLPAQP